MVVASFTISIMPSVTQKQSRGLNITWWLLILITHLSTPDLFCFLLRCSRRVTNKGPKTQSPRLTPLLAKSEGMQENTQFKKSLWNHLTISVRHCYLQNEHILPEVVSVFEDDANWVFGQSGGVSPFKLQPKWLLLGRHNFALLDLRAQRLFYDPVIWVLKCSQPLFIFSSIMFPE